jgi:hypothetical protein
MLNRYLANSATQEAAGIELDGAGHADAAGSATIGINMLESQGVS